MMDNDKWVWSDEDDSGRLALPPRDRKLAPIIDWLDATPELPIPVDLPPAPPAAPPPETRPPSPPAPPAANAAGHRPAPRKSLPPSVVQAIVLHLEGKLDEAIQEIQAGLRNGEPAAELYTAMGALQMERERFEDAAASYREVLKCEPENEASKRNLALCVEKVNEAKKPPKPPPSLLKAIALHKEGKAEEAGNELQRGIKSGEPPVELYTADGHLQFAAARLDRAADA